MKKLLLLFVALATVVAVSSCKDDEGGKWNPNAKIWINGVDNLNRALTLDIYQNDTISLTCHEICLKDSLCIICGNGAAQFFYINPPAEYDGLGRIDTTSNRLAFIAGNINGYEDNWFLTEQEVILMSDNTKHVYGYVPYAQRQEAYEKIKALWDKEQWEEIYRIFNEAFIFVPCTYEELMEAKAKGLI